MSAMAGVVRFDPLPIEPGVVEAMTAAMAARGPDGIEHWRSPSAALGQCMLRTTPESLLERQPLPNADASAVLVMDGRVDNRGELRHALVASGFVPRDDSDAELVLRAYEAWGDGCPSRIIGECAFLIWDARRRRLFGARDAAGTRHFYYHRGRGFFAFASEIRGLLALPGVQARLNESRLVESLAVEFDREDEVGTFYAGIDRLPGGHAMRVDAGGLATWRYWDPTALGEAKFGSIDECAEAFLEQLRVAVASRVRSIGKVGAALSGGLDSSTIVGLVRKEFRSQLAHPLATFSLVREARSRCPEWIHVQHMVAGGWIESEALSPAVASQVWARYIEAIDHLDEPFVLNNNGYTQLLLCDAARASGCRVLLDGMAGDLSFYWFDQSVDLRSGRWSEVPGVLAASVRHSMPAVWKMVAMRAAAALAPEPARRLYRGLRRDHMAADAQLLRSDLARGLVAKYRPPAGSSRDDRLEHARLYATGLLSMAHEQYGQIAFASGIEPRSPFSDRRVIEFGIRMPREAKLCSGWYKALLRRATAGVLPEAVRWRRDVTMHPGGDFRGRFIAEVARSAPQFWNPSLIETTMGRWIQGECLRRAWQRHDRTGDVFLGMTLLVLAANARWLNSRPVGMLEGATHAP